MAWFSKTPHISVRELKEMMDGDETFQLLDVRDEDEYAFARIKESKHIPLTQLPQRIGELDKDKKTFVLCLSGGRSAQATDYMRQQGFSEVYNVSGGIRAWSEQIDPNVPKY